MITLVAHNTEFQVEEREAIRHSSFIKAALSSNTKECQNKRIELPGFSVSQLCSVIRYFQHREIASRFSPVSPNNQRSLPEKVDQLLQALQAADFLGMQDMLRTCTMHLRGLLRTSFSKSFRCSDSVHFCTMFEQLSSSLENITLRSIHSTIMHCATTRPMSFFATCSRSSDSSFSHRLALLCQVLHGDELFVAFEDNLLDLIEPWLSICPNTGTCVKLLSSLRPYYLSAESRVTFSHLVQRFAGSINNNAHDLHSWRTLPLCPSGQQLGPSIRPRASDPYLCWLNDQDQLHFHSLSDNQHFETSIPLSLLHSLDERSPRSAMHDTITLHICGSELRADCHLLFFFAHNHHAKVINGFTFGLARRIPTLSLEAWLPPGICISSVTFIPTQERIFLLVAGNENARGSLVAVSAFQLRTWSWHSLPEQVIDSTSNESWLTFNCMPQATPFFSCQASEVSAITCLYVSLAKPILHTHSRDNLFLRIHVFSDAIRVEFLPRPPFNLYADSLLFVGSARERLLVPLKACRRVPESSSFFFDLASLQWREAARVDYKLPGDLPFVHGYVGLTSLPVNGCLLGRSASGPRPEEEEEQFVAFGRLETTTQSQQGIWIFPKSSPESFDISNPHFSLHQRTPRPSHGSMRASIVLLNRCVASKEGVEDLLAPYGKKLDVPSLPDGSLSD